ncbi:hypothetical protein Acr_20g0002360 [Actinidia rufa]|uniref:ZFYVE26-like TPR repeats domain-containing protein n=1 Tax=Actinidia rufa TaxID=165716 RepID=A0A7J0GCK1_9ERIC|nr:hypothetical protein Acr_20g0002360 [Actinidia rufa]
MLHQMVEDAHKGKRQFLSGKLHNLARAVADEEAERDYMKGEGPYTDRKLILNYEKDGVLGLGLRALKQTFPNSATGENNVQSAGYDVKDPGRRLFGPLNAKPTTYLSQFILHIAAIGDIVDGTDTTHDFNYFSLVYEWPKDLLTRLVFERGSTDAAGKVAEIMFADFVHEVISACVPPVYPPRSGYGWACIPVTPTSPKSFPESKVLSPSFKDAKPNTYSRSSAIPGIPLYPLQLDIVKHLVKLSPVRAVLACVFGGGMLYRCSDSTICSSLNDGLLQTPDDDRLFYEFALDQSERFPTLNRWIQMQTNLHRVSEFAETAEHETEGGMVKSEPKTTIKRYREHDSDTDSEGDDIAVRANISTALLDLQSPMYAASDPWHESPKSEGPGVDTRVFLSFDWENEGPCEKAVERGTEGYKIAIWENRSLYRKKGEIHDGDNEKRREEVGQKRDKLDSSNRLIDEGKLMDDALALSDRCLRNGASDRLLQLLIEHGEESNSVSGQIQGYAIHSTWGNSWQYCLRLKDKQLAARLALKYLHRWELEAALDVITMCSCHLPESNPVKNEMVALLGLLLILNCILSVYQLVQMRQALLRYKHILCADDHYSSWQEVEAECKQDPEGLALRLAGKGAVSAALEVAESAGLSIELRRELQGRQLVKLLTADPLNGGGPAEASRFLSSLRDTDDALPVVMGAMQLLPNLRSKQLLVHFFLKRRDGNLSDVEVSRLNSWALGLRVLSILPLPWQQRCSSLHEHPHLILEILKEFPSLRDNTVIHTYSAKAIAVSISSLSREPRISVSEARRAFSWTPRNTGDKTAPRETYRKRKSSGLTPTERVAWEAMAGIQEDRVSLYPSDGQERFPSVSIAEEWMLTGDPTKDDAVRSSHRYESAPDIILFKIRMRTLCPPQILALSKPFALAALICICEQKALALLLALCSMAWDKSKRQDLDIPLAVPSAGSKSMWTEGKDESLPSKALWSLAPSCIALDSVTRMRLTLLRALLSLCSDELVSAKGALNLCISQMRNVLSSQQLPENASMETIGRAYHATETFVQGLVFAKSHSSVGSQSTDELSEVLSQADIWLGRAELLQSLLGSGIAASLDDIADQESSGRLRDRLIVDERYSMAVYTCKKCKIDVFPVWNAWGHAQALQLHKGDPAPVTLEIINTIEGSPPVDVSAVRSMYDHLARSAPAILDDSLSADSYLNVLYMPSTFPRSERSRRSQESASDNSLHITDFEDGPRSNLDNVRYLECVNYLQEYACQHLLGFMFRHGHFKDACLLFFPPNAVPPPAQPSSLGIVTSSSSPQRLDPLATDYGTIDDLCDLCIGYGAMPVMEEVLSTRMLSATPQNVGVNQYTVAALVRICIYCESHKHFNYLYQFQVIKKDHVAAGLCCIQLFMNSSLQEEAIKHLENAKMHFDEGLSARYKAGDSTKLVTKGIRGKSASEKLTEEGLVKFSARVAIQVDVVRSFNDPDGPQWKYSLFGNPIDPETFRRRCKIAETLAERNFDLAFQVVYEFNLPAVDIYAGVAASLAERKKGGQLTEFFRNIKGTIDDDDWDQVLGAAVNVYANKHKERPDRLIDMLTSSHR